MASQKHGGHWCSLARMFVGTGPFAGYFLAIYTPAVLALTLSVVWRWRKRRIATDAWLSESITAQKRRRLSPNVAAALVCLCILAFFALVAFVVVGTWGQGMPAH